MSTEVVNVTQTPVNLLTLASGAPQRGLSYVLENTVPHAIVWLAELSASPGDSEDDVGHALLFGRPRRFLMPTDTERSVWVWSDTESLPARLAITQIG